MARAKGRFLHTLIAGLCLLLATFGTLALCPCWGHSWASPLFDRSAASRHMMTGRRASVSMSPSSKEAFTRDTQEGADRNPSRKTGRKANFKTQQTRPSSASYLMGSAVAGAFFSVATSILPRGLVLVSASKAESAKQKVKESLKDFIPPGSKREKVADAIVSAVDKAKVSLDKLVKDGSSAQDFMDGVMDAMGKAEQDMVKDLEGKTDSSSNPLDKITANMYPPIGIVAHDTCAHRLDDSTWEVPIEAWIFRRNEERHKIRLALCQKILVEGRHKIFDVDAKAQEIYEERARLVFRSLVFRGGEEKRRLEARFGNIDGELSEWLPLPAETDSDGRVISSVKIPASDVERITDGSKSMQMQLRCVIPDRETPLATAEARLVDPEGFIVISDIDDTVKVTEVYKGKNQVVRNTFFEEFTAVDGMADLFQSWAKRDPGMSFHFVSNSPPELMEPLHDFMVENGFPQAPLHLRPLRGKDRKVFKQKTIETIMDQFPDRQVALVGDSGEADALIYSNIYKSYPGRVAKIFIREVHESCPAKLEYFDGVPEDYWQVFKSSEEVQMPESIFG